MTWQIYAVANNNRMSPDDPTAPPRVQSWCHCWNNTFCVIHLSITWSTLYRSAHTTIPLCIPLLNRPLICHWLLKKYPFLLHISLARQCRTCFCREKLIYSLFFNSRFHPERGGCMASVRKKEPKMRDYRFATFISSLLYPIITTTPWLMITIFVRKDDIDLCFSQLTCNKLPHFSSSTHYSLLCRWTCRW